MHTRSVAFFRNLNLGQGSSPTRAQLLAAFAGAGVAEAFSFQVNGTVVFAAERPRAVAERVVALLTPVTGYDDAVLVRPVDWLAALELAELSDTTELSLFDRPGSEGQDPFPEPLPWRPPRGDLTVVRADTTHAICVNDLAGRSGGTPALERLLGVPVTSRGLPTIRRLLTRTG